MNNTKCWQGFRETKFLCIVDGRECKLVCLKNLVVPCEVNYRPTI